MELSKIKENLKKSNYKFIIIYMITLAIQIIGSILVTKKYIDEVNELDVNDEAFEENVKKHEWKIKLAGVLGFINSCFGCIVFLKFFGDLFKKNDDDIV